MLRNLICRAAALAAIASPGFAATIFDHDFENAPNPGAAVTTVADLGAPAAGSFSFSGSPVGGIGGARKSFALGHNPNGIANMTQPAANNVTFDAIVDPLNFTFPETQVADAGSGDLLFAEFAGNGGFVNPGAKTEISFNWASFGNQNTGQFKHQYVRGLDAAGNEVFELLLVSGSGMVTRQLYARGADDDSITLTGAGAGTPDGTLLADNFQFNLNGTNVANGRPSGTFTVDIVLENGTVTYDVGASGGSFNSTAANGSALPVNSSATTISRLEFSSVWNASVNGQNKGYWLDDVVVTSVPEPSSLFLVGLCVATAALRAGRRQEN